ncbi:PilC/PilY family type IV pilus protein [Acinetobacter sp. YH16031]|uniref:PilC/PilY family type IV pilus protein n=1 Tax=Acinetobacter sp. YH16031 TaxID=2601180 RepID=UPI0015D10E55|nr:PilC/PilY family type IV pilus protein [Acinetobacter sp. YH16031]
MKQLKNNFLSSCRYKVLAASVAAFSTVLVTTSVTQASDIEIYQDAKSGDITLMFMLDVSGSMTGNSSYDGTGQTRIARLKTAMDDLLNGNASKGITKLADDKIIGLSTLGSPTNSESGAVLVPARRLNTTIVVQECTSSWWSTQCKNVNKTQREILWERINGLSANSNTPTGQSYATTISYLMGTSTKDITNGGWNESDTLTKSGNKYISPPSLTQTDEIKKCSGQGIYVLTDGEPNKGTDTNLSKAAIGKTTFPNCTGTSPGWDCIKKLSAALLDPEKNAKGLKFKTAVVGFGSAFNNIPSYDKTKTQAQNLASLGNVNTNVKHAAEWGILGEGGWYSGNSSQDIVDSVNDFISNLSRDIPSVTTGSPTVPRDELNPAELQDDAYYQTFQPTPNTNYQLWLGNLKKFKVDGNGILKGQGGSRVFNTNGSLVEPTYDANGNITSAVYDYWAKDIDAAVANSDELTVGSRKFAARGGAWSQLLLGAKADKTAQRKLLTNRTANGTGTSATFSGGGTLRQVQLTDLTDITYKNDVNRAYLVSLLGYNLDVANPPTNIDNLLTQQPLRQMGAVMHSYPILVTNKGKLSYNTSTKTMESTGREDYILFGTTQGLLHVVDAKTGAEKFAFVPNEMVENQKNAFRESTVTTGGMQNLYYGVDGSWALDTRYVVDTSGNLTVGNGRTVSQKGWQTAYGGLRMGGRSYYALDLSNINSPTLKFHIDPASQKVYSGSSSKTFTQLQYMGQSWSKPSIAWVNWGGTRKRVMFVGGGYDAGGDDGDARTNGVKGTYAGYENHNYAQTNKKGAGVYMFDADNGDLLWWASANASSTSAATTESGVIATKHNDLKYSVTSQIRTVDRDGDELVDHLYFGDLGGQVFRIDLDNKQTKIGAVPKTPVRLLNLNAAEKSPRFYDMPSFSLYNASGETFALISIGSGNRSQPLQDFSAGDSAYDYDAIYNIYDKDVARRDLFNRTTALNTENVVKADLGEITDTNRFSNTTLIAPYSGKGWFYRFQNCTAGVNGELTNCSSYKKQSEKVFGTPLAMNYKLYVSTFDASKPGISGDCGAGVKGESMITAFCLPYGQCASELSDARDVIGVGIHTVTVGGQKDDPDPDPDCEGDSCPPENCSDEACPPEAEGDSSAKNYCIQTSGRIALTVTGGFGGGEATEMCLIPQRWYEKLARKS